VPEANARDARELIEFYFGKPIVTRPQESDVTVGTTAVKLGSFADTRTAIQISNGGSATIALGFSNGVTAATGIQVAAGGFAQLSWLDDQDLINVDIWAISAMAGNGVHVVESVLSGF
jgi:hypothetical protein